MSERYFDGLANAPPEVREKKAHAKRSNPDMQPRPLDGQMPMLTPPRKVTKSRPRQVLAVDNMGDGVIPHASVVNVRPQRYVEVKEVPHDDAWVFEQYRRLRGYELDGPQRQHIEAELREVLLQHEEAVQPPKTVRPKFQQPQPTDDLVAETRALKQEAAQLKGRMRWYRAWQRMAPAARAHYAQQYPERFMTPEQVEHWRECGAHEPYIDSSGSLHFPLSYRAWAARPADVD